MKRVIVIVLAILICLGAFFGCELNSNSSASKAYNELSEYEKLVREIVQVMYFTEDVISSDEIVDITEVHKITMDVPLESFKDYLLEENPELAEYEDFEEEYRETEDEYVQEIEERFFCKIDDIEDIHIIGVEILKDDADSFGVDGVSGDDANDGFLVAVGRVDGSARVLVWEGRLFYAG